MEYEETDVPEGVQDMLPEMPSDDVPPVSDFEYSCEVCGVELTYGGRGRKPKRCAEHKTGARSGKTPARASGGRWQQPLTDALTQQFVMVGMMVYPFENFDGQTIITGSPQLATSLVGVAEQSPAVRDALQKLVTTGAWAQVAAAVAAIAIPICMHHGIMPKMKIPGMASA